MGIDVNAELAPFLDAVLLSFIVLEAARRGSSGHRLNTNGDGGDLGQKVEEQSGSTSVAAIVAFGAVAGAAVDEPGGETAGDGGHGEHNGGGDHGAPAVNEDHRYEVHEEYSEHGGGVGGDGDADGDGDGADGGGE